MYDLTTQLIKIFNSLNSNNSALQQLQSSVEYPASSIRHHFFNRIPLARMDHSRGTSIVTVAV